MKKNILIAALMFSTAAASVAHAENKAYTFTWKSISTVIPMSCTILKVELKTSNKFVLNSDSRSMTIPGPSQLDVPLVVDANACSTVTLSSNCGGTLRTQEDISCKNMSGGTIELSNSSMIFKPKP